MRRDEEIELVGVCEAMQHEWNENGTFADICYIEVWPVPAPG